MSKLQKRLLLLVLLTLITATKDYFDTSPAPPDTTPILGTQNQETAMVTRVIDGDTLEINHQTKVRLIGIDAPETKPNDCYALESKLALEALTLNHQVTLETDVSNTDLYQRLLRYIWINGQLINQELIRQGYAIAKAYPPDTKYRSQLNQAQQEAQAETLGLWQYCH